MKQNIKVSVRKKGDHSSDISPEMQQKIDEAKHFIHGLIKKGENVKQMMEKLNEHDHKQPDGSDWTYDALHDFIEQYKP